MLDADVHKGKDKPHADKSGQEVGGQKSGMFAEVFYGRPLSEYMYIKVLRCCLHSTHCTHWSAINAELHAAMTYTVLFGN